MMREKGDLIIGVEHGGKVHTSFVLRPQLVRDTIEVMGGDEAEQAARNAHFCGACLMARQIESLGDIPKDEITTDLVLSLTDIDFEVISKARETLDKRLRSFRRDSEASQKNGAGSA